MQTTNAASSVQSNSKPPTPVPPVINNREAGGNIRPMPDPYRGTKKSA